MSEADPRRPEREAESAPDSGGEPGSRRPGEAYTAMPEFPEKPKRRWWLAAAAAGLLALGAGAYMKAKAPPPLGPAALAGAVQEDKVFLVGLQDLDQKKTSAARELLKKGLPAPDLAMPGKPLVAPPSAKSAPVPGTMGAAPVQPEASLAQELANMPAPVLEQIRDGGMSLFTFRFLDWVEEDGDVMDIEIDGRLVGRVTLSHGGADLTVPLKPKESHVIRVIAVHDGGGGVTFAAQSSAGEMRTRVMSVGESETWTIGFR